MVSESSPTDLERRDAFVEQIGAAATGAFELAAMAIGLRLGLYAALADGGPSTAAELAGRTGTAERPIREWLEHGAVNGHLEVVGESDDPGTRRFALPAAHAEVLLDRDSLSYGGPTPPQALAAIASLPLVLESFRTGTGFAFGDTGDDMRDGEAAANRPAYLGPLGREWLPSIADLHDRLLADPPARIADVGCGLGWSSIGMARAYPRVSVDGLDLDEISVGIARRNAEDAGLGNRVRFVQGNAAAPGLTGGYDLVTMFESFHDMSHPVEILGSFRALLAPGGSILIVDLKAAETFTAPGDDLDRYLYGWSVLSCLHDGLQNGGVGTGTVMRPSTLQAYAREAGLATVEIVPIDHDHWRFYRLRP
ncbi:MAG TPA: class I SAM-dependent methyltransferase [Candidatus Limnocylindrales bacterium]|nr:class I SAM-dependent methyltransferase [Candidatus Limnocylindrales bacterium]